MAQFAETEGKGRQWAEKGGHRALPYAWHVGEGRMAEPSVAKR